jgi:hypothetical protein
MIKKHKFTVGTKVVYTNDFGICWGIKTITGHDTRGYRNTYHIENSDTPWYSIDERNFTKATLQDQRKAADPGYLQNKYGFKPTLEQLGGCW